MVYIIETQNGNESLESNLIRYYLKQTHTVTNLFLSAF